MRSTPRLPQRLRHPNASLHLCSQGFQDSQAIRHHLENHVEIEPVQNVLWHLQTQVQHGEGLRVLLMLIAILYCMACNIHCYDTIYM